MADPGPQRFARRAILLVAGSIVAVHALYLALSAKIVLAFVVRLIAILLCCVIAWQGRGWVRWVLVFFSIGPVISGVRLLTHFAALSLPAGLLLLGHVVFVAGVAALFSRRARPYFARTSRPTVERRGTDDLPG